MRFLYAVTILSCTPVLAQQAVSKIPFSESRHTVPAVSASGARTLDAASVLLDVLHTGGKTERGGLLVFFDGEHGHYFWRFLDHMYPGEIAAEQMDLYVPGGNPVIYISPRSIVELSFFLKLVVEEQTGQAGSLDEAEAKSIQEFRRDLPLFEKKGYYSGRREVKLIPDIDPEFFCGKVGDPDFTPFRGLTSFVSIAQAGDNLRLVVRNHFDQEII